MKPVPLAEASDWERFGGKAAQLAIALQAGLPVPPGFALAVDLVEAIANGNHLDSLQGLVVALGGSAAARSSAADEDGISASFAGQHVTCLNVRSDEAMLASVKAVWESAHAPSALAYRAKLNIATPPRIAVVVQRMVIPRCAGVMFTRNPVNGRDERIIEAAWGLGEAIVQGIVEPDRLRLARGGVVLEWTIGCKDVEFQFAAEGGTIERPVKETRRRAPCLSEADIQILDNLAERCDTLYSGSHDIEWAFSGSDIFLLQRRALTR